MAFCERYAFNALGSRPEGRDLIGTRKRVAYYNQRGTAGQGRTARDGRQPC